MTASWIPTDPDLFLHPEHQSFKPKLEPDWQDDYARWRHSYLPGLRETANQLCPGVNASAFSQAIQPFESVVTKLVPPELMGCVNVNNPQDWDLLPEPQVRRIWKNECSLFSNIVRCMISLQILKFIKQGLVPGFSFSFSFGPRCKLIIENDTIDTDALVKVLRKIEVPEGNATVFSELSIHLAIFQLIDEDRSYWRQLLADPERVKEFTKNTLQPKPDRFLNNFCDGGLITMCTANLMTRWFKQDTNLTSTIHWRYVNLENPRCKACRDEFVPLVDRSAKFWLVQV